MRKFTFALLATAVLSMSSSMAMAQTFNEIRISSPGAEDDVSNFIELAGTAGDSLDSLFLLTISSEFNPGSIDFVFDLSGTAIPDDGFYLASTDATEYGAQTDLATGVDFFGSPTSFLLVNDFTGAQGDDLDADDDGVIDGATPWTSIIDSVSLVDGDANADFQYGPGPVVGPDGTFAPGHLFRDADATGTFQIGLFGDRSFDTPGVSNVAAAIPEPSSMLALGLIAIAGATRRRRS